VPLSDRREQLGQVDARQPVHRAHHGFDHAFERLVRIDALKQPLRDWRQVSAIVVVRLPQCAGDPPARQYLLLHDPLV
jgi:hypothetical protein